ncbi:MAG: fatty acid cis/trans isomerase [Inhella sp.]|uniref:fatty acid cis/trans isomerase n=1 Tax=Inhella sp. TaxID=1921806 RepID=UPI00391F33F8
MLTVSLAGCATWVSSDWVSRFGPAEPTRFDQPVAVAPGAPTYLGNIKPILDQRCAVCHGCYDAPCQLKLTSFEGLTRGLTKAPVYGELRWNEAPLTRLGLDAQKPSQWRRMGFEPVLNEHPSSPQVELEASVLWRSLALKQSQPLPAVQVLPPAFDFSLDRSNSCPSAEAYGAHAERQPHGGMPYGLPGLTEAEMALVQRWLQAGAPKGEPQALPAAVLRQVAQWERFLNGDSLKAQLVGRYLYEHLFLGSLVFEGDPQRHIFKLVRSKSPPGQPVDVIATRRPFDPPGVARPYYRLAHSSETVLAKTHMPYTLGAARLARWTNWFVRPDFQVAVLPGYDPDAAANPFQTFAALPLDSRYRFLLDDSGFFVSNFIKGPVCRGQTALDVINDRFWVFFVDPAIGANDDAAQLVAREAALLRMPAADGSNSSLLSWRAVAQAEDALLAAKTRHMERVFGAGRKPIDLDFVWKGDGHNPNAALTIFRHFDSATVERGLVGDAPKTAWVIGYPLLERIYYLLVAGFDVYGNTSHQLQTRLAMDFLRMEGEAHFLMLLPQSARIPLRDAWYRGASDEVKQRVLGGVYRFDAESGIAYPPGADPQQHLYGLLNDRLAPVLNRRHALNIVNEPNAQTLTALNDLAQVEGAALQWLPEMVLLRVEAEGPYASAPRHYSLLRNSAHTNVSSPFRESSRLVPSEHTLTVAAGFVGAYPNAIWRVGPSQLPDLVKLVRQLGSEADYRALVDRFGVRRTSHDFWSTSDALMRAYQGWAPAEAGLLDWSRLENR